MVGGLSSCLTGRVSDVGDRRKACIAGIYRRRVKKASDEERMSGGELVELTVHNTVHSQST